ncbi:MAG: putative hydro-lyase [Synergistetes bacterium]|nr:putative hydro-lyase [Synergistota bacterium]
MTPEEARRMIREEKWTKPTSGLAPSYAQANLVILPEEDAYDFLLFAQRNPKPCPLLEVLDVGDPRPKLMASNADIRYDLPKYRVYMKGELVDEPLNIEKYWREDLVAFLIGCSFSFEWALMEEGVPMRHIENGKNVPMYITNIQCVPAGKFSGPMVVSARPIPYDLVVRAAIITSRFPRVHGAPIHIGYPELIGIKDIMEPDFGDPPILEDGDIMVFWACGVTPQAVAMQAKPGLMITHSPGHMFITDVKNGDLTL